MYDDPVLFPVEAAEHISNAARELADRDSDSISYQEMVINHVEEIMQTLKDHTRRPYIRACLIKTCADITADVAYDMM